MTMILIADAAAAVVVVVDDDDDDMTMTMTTTSHHRCWVMSLMQMTAKCRPDDGRKRSVDLVR